MRRKTWLAVALAAGWTLSIARCFTPLQPPCAFSCAGDQLCPAGYACGADGFCHRPGDHGVCDLTPTDAAVDAPPDTSPDL